MMETSIKVVLKTGGGVDWVKKLGKMEMSTAGNIKMGCERARAVILLKTVMFMKVSF